MDPNLLTVAVAIISAGIGYLFWVWQNRLRPWVTPTEFTGSLRARDSFPVSAELASATNKSSVIPNLHAPEADMGDFMAALTTATTYLERTKRSSDVLKEVMADFASVQTTEQQIDSVRRLVRDRGIEFTLVTNFYQGRLAIPPGAPAAAPAIGVLYQPTEDGGRYLLEFAESTVRVGEGLERLPFAKKRIEPLIENVSQLNIQALVPVLTQLLAIITDERLMAADVRAQCEGIITEHTRWACQLSITNFGATPFIVLPDGAELRVEERGFPPITLPCILTQKDEDGDSVPNEGVVVVPPGATQQFGVVTAQSQKEMAAGHHVRVIYTKKSGVARVRLRAHGIASVGRDRLTSQPATFAGEDVI